MISHHKSPKKELDGLLLGSDIFIEANKKQRQHLSITPNHNRENSAYKKYWQVPTHQDNAT